MKSDWFIFSLAFCLVSLLSFVAASEETVEMKEIRFQGSKIFSQEELLALARPYLERPLTIQEIEEFCALIETRYRAAGYIFVQAFAPEQEIQDGALKIKIVEGCLEEIIVCGNQYYSSSFIENYFSSLKGKPIRQCSLLAALRRLNEQEDLIASLQLLRGKEPGCARLLVEVEDRLPLHIYFTYDDEGNPLSSQNRFGARLERGGFLSEGDRLILTGVLGVPYGRDLQFSEAVYRFLCSKGEAEISLSCFQTNSVLSDFSTLALRGESTGGAIRGERLLWEREDALCRGFISFESKRVKNCSRKRILSLDALHLGGLGCLWKTTDRFCGENALEVASYLELSPLWKEERKRNFLSGQKRGNLFASVQVDYLRKQFIAGERLLLLRGTGQLAFNKLPLSEQFYLGGADTVRGYPLAYALGDHGYCFNGEYRFPPPLFGDKKSFFSSASWKERLQLLTFIDHGMVYLKRCGKMSSEKIFLTGVGFGLRLLGPYNIGMSVDIGFPLSHCRRLAKVVGDVKINWQML